MNDRDFQQQLQRVWRELRERDRTPMQLTTVEREMIWTALEVYAAHGYDDVDVKLLKRLRWRFKPARTSTRVPRGMRVVEMRNPHPRRRVGRPRKR
jgi:hypothetical protein